MLLSADVVDALVSVIVKMIVETVQRERLQSQHPIVLTSFQQKGNRKWAYEGVFLTVRWVDWAIFPCLFCVFAKSLFGTWFVTRFGPPMRSSESAWRGSHTLSGDLF